MKTINIKGKEYVPVVERIKEFHRLYPNGEIITEIIGDGPERIVVKATVKIPRQAKKTLSDGAETIEQISDQTFTGHSQALYGEGRMGDVALEVAETSAIGRALGFANIGLIDGIASADEIRKVKKVDGDKNDDLEF